MAQGTSDTPRLLTVKEVAQHWRVTERTVYAWITRGDVETVKVGGTRRIVAASVLPEADRAR